MANKKQQPARATQSFAQLVSDAQIKVLQPYIQQQVTQQVAQACQGLYGTMMQERATMLTRQTAVQTMLLENCPWFTLEKLQDKIEDVEDAAQGLSPSDFVQAGDTVRVEVTVQAPGQTEWTKPTRLPIYSVGTKGPNGSVQTHESLENALMGAKVGETVEATIAEENPEGDSTRLTTFKLTVKRISFQKKAE